VRLKTGEIASPEGETEPFHFGRRAREYLGRDGSVGIEGELTTASKSAGQPIGSRHRERLGTHLSSPPPKVGVRVRIPKGGRKNAKNGSQARLNTLQAAAGAIVQKRGRETNS